MRFTCGLGDRPQQPDYLKEAKAEQQALAFAHRMMEGDMSHLKHTLTAPYRGKIR